MAYNNKHLFSCSQVCRLVVTVLGSAGNWLGLAPAFELGSGQFCMFLHFLWTSSSPTQVLLMTNHRSLIAQGKTGKTFRAAVHIMSAHIPLAKASYMTSHTINPWLEALHRLLAKTELLG